MLALILAAAANWIPARWNSADPATLTVVRETPVNCLLVERGNWSAEFSAAAEKAGIVTLGVIRTQADRKDLPALVRDRKLSGIAAEGDFEPAQLAALRDSRIPVVELPSRTRLRFHADQPVVATAQGVWPGINAAPEGETKAAPSGAPWIDTNAGFLRFVRALTPAPVWIANSPSKGQIYPEARYLQAIGDAAMTGARWVVALDADLEKRLLSGDAKALDTWRRIGAHLAFYESHKEWRDLGAYGQLAIVQETGSGGLISGGILDMISVKHTPVRPLPGRRLQPGAMDGAVMAVNVDPASLSDERKEVLRAFTRAGGTLLTAPPGWKFPPQRPGQITLDKEDVDKLHSIWKEVNAMTGRRNLGARLFNVSGMLSNLVGPPSGSPLVLHLVNYSDYPVENVTVHVLGKRAKAMLLRPGEKDQALTSYETEDGSGFDLDNVGSVAALVIE